MNTVFYNPTQIITVDTQKKNYKRGSELSEIGILTDHSIIVKDGIIAEIIPTQRLKPSDYESKIDLTNKIMLPGLVECHTHSVFAGSRASEFNKRLSGTSYEEIANSGGGINSTVKAVRESSFEELVELSKQRVENFISQGITTLEIKSGYGLSFYDEIKLLQVIKHLDTIYKIDIIPTFLGAHTFPPEYYNDKEQYIDIIINKMLPFVVENNLAKYCDAFCELTAFSPKQVEKIFIAAKKLGLELKLHTDQFNSIGGLDLALDMNALSVDHLEVLNNIETEKFQNSETVAVLLPGVSFSLQYNYGPAQQLKENNAIIALATDYNPGSSHINNISLIWALAAFNLNMKLEEIIAAYTINSAKALNLSETIGSIEIGKKADFAIYKTNNYSDLLYNMANNLIEKTVKNGKIVYEK